MAYIDANPFIYAAIELPTDAKAVQSRDIFIKIASGKILASTSILTWDELVWVCRKSLPTNLAIKIGLSMISLPKLEIMEANKLTAVKASALMDQYGLKPRDAIHAATAILNGEREIITDDADFGKVKELKRISLAEASR